MDGEIYREEGYGTLIDELRRGFENLGRDIRGALGATNAGIDRLSGDIRYGTGLVRGAGRTFAGGVGGRAFNFMSETFSKEFNRPALWSRDIVYMLGKDPRDMTQAQAQYYAREHWNQRFSQLGSFVAKDVAPIAMLAGGIPGVVASLGYEAFISPHIVDQKALYKWKNYLDRASQSYVLAGASENIVTGRGWSKQQLESIGRFHLRYEKENRYFKKEEQFAIEELATSQGYYQKTTSMAQYKRKYKELIEGTKEVMKVLHTSMEEAVGVMSEISRLKVTDQRGFIKGVGMAAAFSGLSSQQVLRYTGAFGMGMERRGFERGYGAEVGLELIKQPAKDFTAYTIDRYTKNRITMAGFFTPGGKFDVDVFNRFMKGQERFVNITGRGIQNINRWMEQKTLSTWELNREKMIAANVTPEQYVRWAPLLSYEAFRSQRLDLGWTNQEIFQGFLAEEKGRGATPEELEQIRAIYETPLKGRQWAEMVAPDIRRLQGRGNIFQQAWRYTRMGWAGTIGKVSDVISEEFNKYGFGPLSTGLRDIERKGRLDERYLVARRIRENFKYKEVGKWLDVDLSGMEWVRFRRRERAEGSTVDWDIPTWKAEAVRLEMDKYNRLIGYVQGEEEMEYDKTRAHGIRGDIARTLGEYQFTPGGVGWYRAIRPLAEKYGFSPEFQAAFREEVRTRMQGEHWKTLRTFTYGTRGLTTVERMAMEKEEIAIWNLATSLGVPEGLEKAIKALPQWGKYREKEPEITREKWIKRAMSELIKTDIGARLEPKTLETIISTVLAGYEEGPDSLIERIRAKTGEIDIDKLKTMEEALAAITGTMGGAISIEDAHNLTETIWVLKECVKSLFEEIAGEKPTPMSVPE